MTADFIEPYRSMLVVCELNDGYLAIGTLTAYSADHLRLEDVDLHDHKEANSTKDVYLIETRRHGVRANRKKIDIPRSTLVALCALDDIIE